MSAAHCRQALPRRACADAFQHGVLHGFKLAHAGNVNNIGVGGNECFQTVRRRRRIVFQGHAACGDIGKTQQLRRTARNAAFKLHRYVLRRAVQYGNALAFLRHFCPYGGNAFIHVFIKFFCFCFITGYFAQYAYGIFYLRVSTHFQNYNRNIIFFKIMYEFIVHVFIANYQVRLSGNYFFDINIINVAYLRQRFIFFADACFCRHAGCKACIKLFQRFQKRGGKRHDFFRHVF